MIRAQGNPGRGAWATLALVVAACQGAPGGTPSAPTVQPTMAPSPVTTAAANLPPIPAGKILYMRMDDQGVEHYHTVNSDGSDPHRIFVARFCGCADWMADGSRVMSLGESGPYVWSLMTIRPDGSDRVVIPAPSTSLSLAVGATSPDGKWLAFNAWDNDDPTDDGLYRAHPDLTGLHHVLPLQAGMLSIEPFGVTPDGARIVFFAETGPHEGITHAGDVYVVNADGTDLRRLNPADARAGFFEAPVVSLSPDGRRAAFAAGGGVFVADLASGEATRVTDNDGFAWFVSWSPSGEWLAYTVNRGGTNVIALVRPDGSDAHEITSATERGGNGYAVWSPDGTTLLMARGHGDSDRDLWIIDLEGNELGQVTSEPSSYVFYSWAPAPSR